MTSRERVLRGLSFQPTDRVPCDLGGMASTGISCFAYPRLVAALGLPPRLPRVHDTSQMLALPDLDVLDALGCDVVTVFWGVTNALEEPAKWLPFDFGGRLPARVRDPSLFVLRADGSVEQPRWKISMPPSSYVFESDGAGQSLDYITTGDLGLKDLAALREELKAALPTPAEVREVRDHCRRVRASTDRAVFYNGPGHSEIAISGHGGIGVFPVICLLHPDYAAEYHEIMTAQTTAKLEMVLPEIRDSVDVVLLGGDDWGSQLTTFAPPEVFRTLFLPYYTRMNETAHRLAPGVKTFIHTCGAVFDVIDIIIESGFDILNPVQWTAGGRGFRAWKEKCRGRIALWGGGVDTQGTLPLGTVADVEREVAEVVDCLSDGSGYVFNSIHNILAEIEPEKIMAMYRTAANAGRHEREAMAEKREGTGELKEFFGEGFFSWQFSSEEHRRRWEERQYDAERWWGGFSRDPVPEPAPLPSWAIGPFTKHPGNPVFAPSESGWDRGHFGGGVHNGAVVRDKGRFIYVYRGEDSLSGRWKQEYAGTGVDYICDIGAAGSDDGVHFTREAGPFFRAGPDERYSFEDVCLVRHEGVFHLFCNRWDWSRVADPSVCGVFHAVSPDLRRWEKLGLVFPRATVIHRNGVVVQNPANEAVRIGGRFVMYINGGLVATSDDLLHWESRQAPELWPGGEGCMALADYAPSRADNRILLFTGGHHTGHFYAVGEVSFDKADPLKPLAWLPRAVLHADASVPWEDGRSAEPPHRPVSYWRDTVFFTGMTPHDGKWWAYYGGSEYYTCLATAPAE